MYFFISVFNPKVGFTISQVFLLENKINTYSNTFSDFKYSKRFNQLFFQYHKYKKYIIVLKRYNLKCFIP